MKNYIIWLDSEAARIFELTGSGIKKSVCTNSQKDHHTRHKNDLHEDPGSEHYFRDLAAKVADSDQLLLMGPGLAKNHFQKFLASHHATVLAKKVIGLETLEGFEHLSENQMFAAARKFYKTYDLFNNPI